MIDWDKLPNFIKAEFDCQETGENEMQFNFMLRLQALRTEYGKPLRVTSGYRSQKHSIERRKAVPGAHTKGRAVDLAVSHAEAHKILALAFKHGFTGIGVNQKGGVRFVHLDDLQPTDGFPRPTVWSY